MPIELASSAISSRASDVPIADCAAESSSSATTLRPELLEQRRLVVGPGPRLGVVDGQDADDVAGRRDQRHAEVGLDLART